MTDPEFLSLMQAKYPRYVWIGHVTGQVRLSGPAWDAVREHVWRREGGVCQETGINTLLEKGHWSSMHCAHVRSKGAGGSDLPSNLRCLSLGAHAAEHAGKL